MSEEQALLRAIAAEPDDDLPRLIYADWCEENGRPERADFVRVQCRLAPPRGPAADEGSLRRREAELIGLHAGRWFGHDLPGAHFGPPERGFPAGIDVADWPAFAPHLAAALDALPATGLTLRRADGDALRDLARNPAAARLTELSLERGDLDRAALAALTDSPHLANLRVLEMRNTRVAPGLCAEMADRAAFPRLRSLRLCRLRLTDGDAADLCRAAHWERLAELDLAENRAAGGFLTGAAASPVFARLRSLKLFGNPLTVSAAGGEPACGVTRLDLGRCGGADAVLSWAASPLFANVEDLYLAGPPEGALARLAVGPSAASLTRLDLYGGGLPARPAAYDSLPVPPRLGWLCVGGAGLDGLRAAALIGWLGDTPLETLIMADNRLGPRATAALGASPLAGRLRALDCDTARMGDAGLAAWLDAGPPPGLLGLSLCDNELGPDAVAGLAASPAASELRVLHLAGNPLDDEAARRLIASPNLENLYRLTLDGNRLDEETVEALRERFGPAVQLS